MLKTLIVDDHAGFREALKDILHTNFPAIDVTVAGDADEALRQVDTLVPDLIFMDIRLPGGSGLRLTKKIKSSHPDIVIAILTSHDLPEYRKAAFENGASYFILKSAPTEDIVALVESALSVEHQL